MLARKLMMAGGDAPKTYAKFSPSRKHSSLTLSNSNYSIGSASTPNWVAAYLDTDKVSGVWAFEYWCDTVGDGGNYTITGISNALTTNLFYFGSTSYSAGGAQIVQGYSAVNGGLTASWFDTNSAANFIHLIVIDFDTNKIYMKRSGSLQTTDADIGAVAHYTGMSFFIGTNRTYTINTGYQAFTSGNKSLIATLASSLGKPINEGVWS
jgi:hypothetical protein